MRRSRQHIQSAAFCCARKNRSAGRRQTIRATFPRRFSDTKMGEKKKSKKKETHISYKLKVVIPLMLLRMSS